MKSKKSFHNYGLIAIILIILIVAWRIRIAPALECSRCLGIDVGRDSVTEVFEADYGTIYFLRVSAVDSATISSRLGANAVDKLPAHFIPELGYRAALGKSSKCYRVNNYRNGFICHIALFTDSNNCVVMVVRKGSS
jgi:hypothetical protein